MLDVPDWFLSAGRGLGKELFVDHAVRLSGQFILVFGDALSDQEGN